LARIRGFFAARAVLEVDTPALSSAAVTDPHLQSFKILNSEWGSLYLQTSPEFAMKRLLAAGSGDIYQLAKVFRDGERGRRHNPEFTLLEWYRQGFDTQQLMAEVRELILAVLPTEAPIAVQYFTYTALFQRELAIHPLQASIEELTACAYTHLESIPDHMPTDDRDIWLDLLLSHCIEPPLNPKALTFVYDYPASQAALARLKVNQPLLADRFELYWGSIELANGFHELNNADEQRRRFEADNQMRAQRGLPLMPIDEEFLAALPQLPDCAGVALGIDRLLMLAAGKTDLADVLAFPFTR
jgi:lysyl-tRNA synthetase class 2